MAATFHILIELEKNASIQTLAALHQLPGIAHIHLDFDNFNKKPRQKLLPPPNEYSEPRATKPRKARAAATTFSPSKAVIKMIAENNGPMTRKQIVESGGVNGERMVSNVASMVKTKKLRQVGPATFDLSAETRRALAKAAAEGIPAATNGAAAGNGKMTGAETILTLFTTPETVVTVKQMREAFKLAGRSPASVGDQVGKLKGEKKIKRVPKGPGVAKGSYVRI